MYDMEPFQSSLNKLPVLEVLGMNDSSEISNSHKKRKREGSNRDNSINKKSKTQKEISENVKPKEPNDPNKSNDLPLTYPTASLNPLNSADIKILIVDDSLLQQKILAGLLKRLGYKSDFVSNGDLAVKRVSLNSYDIVFMDICMPVLDGYGAAKQIKKIDHIPPPFLCASSTQSTTEEEKLKCYQSGFDFCLPKPVSLSQLKQILEIVCNSTTKTK